MTATPGDSRVTSTPPAGRPGFGWVFWVLVAAFVVLDAWWRGHTIGPTVRDALGFAPYPVVAGRAEPLDCDEAAYGYIGSNIAQGSVMYRDLSENKPPLGYWLYALTVAIGGANETALRLMPLPPIALTLLLLALLARRLRGGLLDPGVAMGGFILLSTDPYLYGNGAHMEHFLNLFAVLALWAIVHGWSQPAGSRSRFGWLVLAGAGVGLGALVKQVAAVQGPIFAVALALGGWGLVDGRSRWRSILADWGALVVGFTLSVALAAAILVVQGAGRDAWADVVEYGSALATLKAPDPGTPSPLVRWLTGNADPEGRLPDPFRGADLLGQVVRGFVKILGQTPPPTGETNYLVWWGWGSWPVWLASMVALGSLVRFRRRKTTRSVELDRLVVIWTLILCVETLLPGLYWKHYYLLPTPGLALAVALALADALADLFAAVPSRQRGRALGAIVRASLLLAGLGATVWIQVSEYLLVPPEQLTVRYKGGGQWVVLRDLAARLDADARTAWPDGTDPGLFIWGWQSPLQFYGQFQSPTRHFFTDPLLNDYALGHHQTDPRVRPRVERIIRDLTDQPPGLIFVAYPPFPELRAFLQQRGYRFSAASGIAYSPSGLGLWVDPTHFAAFERADARLRKSSSPR